MNAGIKDRESKIRKVSPRSESGSVFTVLLAGIAIAAALSVVLYQTISGPMSSMVRVANKTSAKSQMQSVGNILIMAAINQSGALPSPWSNGECDNNNGNTNVV